MTDEEIVDCARWNAKAAATVTFVGSVALTITTAFLFRGIKQDGEDLQKRVDSIEQRQGKSDEEQRRFLYETLKKEFEAKQP